MIKSETKLSQLIEYYQQLRKAFKWDHQLIHILGALLLISDKKSIDTDEIKAVRQIIKRRCGMFSYFRGTNELLLAILIYCKSNEQRTPDQIFSEVHDTYTKMRHSGLKSSLFLVTGALHLAQFIYEKDATMGRTLEDLANQTHAFYQGMKKQHFWLTGHESQIYALMLAMADCPLHETLTEAERFYHDLRHLGFSRGSALQNLSHVLALGENSYELRRDIVNSLNHHLIYRRYKLNRYQMPFLGVLTLVSDRPENLADEAIEMSEWLTNKKGFGSWSIDKKMRFTLAASLASLEYLHKDEGQISQSVLTGSIQSAILAQQAAMIAAISSASAASAAAASG